MLKLGLDPSITQWRIACFAADCGLIFYDKVAVSESNPAELIWSSRDGMSHFHYVDDPIISLKYLAFAGPGAPELYDRAGAELPVLTLRDALARLSDDESEEDRVTTASLLGLLAPAGFDPECFEAMKSLLFAPSRSVRRRAIMAAAYPAWPQFRPLLESLRDGDSEPDVRGRAEAALEAYDRLGIAG